MRVLITGGSGLLGKQITKELLHLGHEVAHYTTGKAGNSGNVRKYNWNPAKGEADPHALEGVTHVVHLAGATIAQRWTPSNKKEIRSSRIQSTQLLKRLIQGYGSGVKAVVSASAIGYYPNTLHTIHREVDAPGEGFLADVVTAWENEVIKIREVGPRTVRLRIGIVLSTEGGALPPQLIPHKFGLGAAVGSGKQWVSWVHIDDLCKAFIHALKTDSMEGPFNAVAPQPVTNLEFNKRLAAALGRPFFLPKIPAFLLKLLLGEMSELVLASQRCSNERLELSGFVFRFGSLEKALDDLLNKKSPA